MTRFLVGALLVLPLAGCGGSSVTSSSSSNVAGLLDYVGALDPHPVVTISSAGVSPSVSHLARSAPVTFVNGDTVEHTVSDAPDLGYGDCPEVRALGTLAPSEQKVITVERLGVACAFRDTAHTGGPPFAGLLVVH